MWLITEGGLSCEFTSHGLYSENFFPDDRLEWLVSETQHSPIYLHYQAVAYRWGWLYQLNYAFRIQIRSFTYNPCGFLPRTHSNHPLEFPFPLIWFKSSNLSERQRAPFMRVFVRSIILAGKIANTLWENEHLFLGSSLAINALTQHNVYPLLVWVYFHRLPILTITNTKHWARN